MDREKVVKEYEDYVNSYISLTTSHDYEFEMHKAVLELLKEQEAVEPIKKDTVEIKSRYKFDCPCGAPLLIGQPYCAGCGKKVKWE